MIGRAILEDKVLPVCERCTQLFSDDARNTQMTEQLSLLKATQWDESLRGGARYRCTIPLGPGIENLPQHRDTVLKQAENLHRKFSSNSQHCGWGEKFNERMKEGFITDKYRWLSDVLTEFPKFNELQKSYIPVGVVLKPGAIPGKTSARPTMNFSHAPNAKKLSVNSFTPTGSSKPTVAKISATINQLRLCPFILATDLSRNFWQVFTDMKFSSLSRILIPAVMDKESGQLLPAYGNPNAVITEAVCFSVQFGQRFASGLVAAVVAHVLRHPGAIPTPGEPLFNPDSLQRGDGHGLHHPGSDILDYVCLKIDGCVISIYSDDIFIGGHSLQAVAELFTKVRADFKNHGFTTSEKSTFLIAPNFCDIPKNRSIQVRNEAPIILGAQDETLSILGYKIDASTNKPLIKLKLYQSQITELILDGDEPFSKTEPLVAAVARGEQVSRSSRTPELSRPTEAKCKNGNTCPDSATQPSVCLDLGIKRRGIRDTTGLVTSVADCHNFIAKNFKNGVLTKRRLCAALSSLGYDPAGIFVAPITLATQALWRSCCMACKVMDAGGWDDALPPAVSEAFTKHLVFVLSCFSIPDNIQAPFHHLVENPVAIYPLVISDGGSGLSQGLTAARGFAAAACILSKSADNEWKISLARTSTHLGNEVGSVRLELMGICTGTNLLQELRDVFARTPLPPQVSVHFIFGSDSKCNLMRLRLPTHLLDKWSCGRVASACAVLFDSETAVFHTPRKYNAADVLCKGNLSTHCYKEFQEKLQFLRTEFALADGPPSAWTALNDIPHIRDAPQNLKEELLPRKAWEVLEAVTPGQVSVLPDAIGKLAVEPSNYDLLTAAPPPPVIQPTGEWLGEIEHVYKMKSVKLTGASKIAKSNRYKVDVVPEYDQEESLRLENLAILDQETAGHPFSRIFMRFQSNVRKANLCVGLIMQGLTRWISRSSNSHKFNKSSDFSRWKTIAQHHDLATGGGLIAAGHGFARAKEETASLLASGKYQVFINDTLKLVYVFGRRWGRSDSPPFQLVVLDPGSLQTQAYITTFHNCFHSSDYSCTHLLQQGVYVAGAKKLLENWSTKGCYSCRQLKLQTAKHDISHIPGYAYETCYAPFSACALDIFYGPKCSHLLNQVRRTRGATVKTYYLTIMCLYTRALATTTLTGYSCADLLDGLVRLATQKSTTFRLIV
ncbi:hypothetical protein, partial [Litorimonas sp.]|uniref:hypothetical protein n=1 Tax=Litorimonas sp. TaxID=1892381 RepID=UPI003A838C9B